MNLDELQIRISMELDDLNKQLKNVTKGIDKALGPKTTKKLMTDNNKVIKNSLTTINKTTLSMVKKTRKDTTKEVNAMSKDINKSLTKAFDIDLVKFNSNITSAMNQAKTTVRAACNDIRRELNNALNAKGTIRVTGKASATGSSNSSAGSEFASSMASSQYIGAMIIKATNAIISENNKNTKQIESKIDEATNKITAAIKGIKLGNNRIELINDNSDIVKAINDLSKKIKEPTRKSRRSPVKQDIEEKATGKKIQIGTPLNKDHRRSNSKVDSGLFFTLEQLGHKVNFVMGEITDSGEELKKFLQIMKEVTRARNSEKRQNKSTYEQEGPIYSGAMIGGPTSEPLRGEVIIPQEQKIAGPFKEVKEIIEDVNFRVLEDVNNSLNKTNEHLAQAKKLVSDLSKITPDFDAGSGLEDYNKKKLNTLLEADSSTVKMFTTNEGLTTNERLEGYTKRVETLKSRLDKAANDLMETVKELDGLSGIFNNIENMDEGTLAEGFKGLDQCQEVLAKLSKIDLAHLNRDIKKLADSVSDIDFDASAIEQMRNKLEALRQVRNKLSAIRQKAYKGFGIDTNLLDIQARAIKDSDNVRFGESGSDTLNFLPYKKEIDSLIEYAKKAGAKIKKALFGKSGNGPDELAISIDDDSLRKLNNAKNQIGTRQPKRPALPQKPDSVKIQEIDLSALFDDSSKPKAAETSIEKSAEEWDIITNVSKALFKVDMIINSKIIPACNDAIEGLRKISTSGDSLQKAIEKVGIQKNKNDLYDAEKIAKSNLKELQDMRLSSPEGIDTSDIEKSESKLLNISDLIEDISFKIGQVLRTNSRKPITASKLNELSQRTEEESYSNGYVIKTEEAERIAISKLRDFASSINNTINETNRAFNTVLKALNDISLSGEGITFPTGVEEFVNSMKGLPWRTRDEEMNEGLKAPSFAKALEDLKNNLPTVDFDKGPQSGDILFEAEKTLNMVEISLNVILSDIQRLKNEAITLDVNTSELEKAEKVLYNVKNVVQDLNETTKKTGDELTREYITDVNLKDLQSRKNKAKSPEIKDIQLPSRLSEKAFPVRTHNVNSFSDHTDKLSSMLTPPQNDFAELIKDAISGLIERGAGIEDIDEAFREFLSMCEKNSDIFKNSFDDDSLDYLKRTIQDITDLRNDLEKAMKKASKHGTTISPVERETYATRAKHAGEINYGEADDMSLGFSAYRKELELLSKLAGTVSNKIKEKLNNAFNSVKDLKFTTGKFKLGNFDFNKSFDSHVAVHQAGKIKEQLSEIKTSYKQTVKELKGVINGLMAPIKKIGNIAYKSISSGLNKTKTALNRFANACKSAWSKIVGIFRKGAKDSAGATNNLKNTVKGLVGQFVSFYTIWNGAKMAIQSAEGLMQGEQKLTTVMKNRMKATNDSVRAINKLIDAQAQLGVVSKQVQYNASQQLSVFLQSSKALETLIPSMNDLIAQQYGANATLEEGAEVARKLGQAIVEGEFTELQESTGITLSEAEIEKFRALTTEEERAAYLAQILADRIGNMNEQLANTPYGAITQLKNNFMELLGTVGALIVTAIKPLVQWLNQIVIACTKAIKAFGEFLGFSFDATSLGIAGGGSVGEGIEDTKEGLEDATEAAEKFKGSLMGFDELNILTDNTNKSESKAPTTDGSIAGGGEAFADDEGALDIMSDKMKAFLDEILEPFKKAWELLGDDLIAEWQDLKESFKHFCDSLGKFLVSVWEHGGKEFVQHMAEIGLACAIAAMEIGGEILDSLARLWDHLDPAKNMNTQGFLNALNEVSVKLRDFILGLGDHFESLMANGGQDVLNALGDCFMNLGESATRGLGIAIDALDGFIDHLDPAVNENTKNMLQSLADMFHAVGQTALDFVSLLESCLVNGGQNMINAFGDMMMNMGQSTSEVITTIMTSFSELFKYLDPTTNEITKNMMKAWEDAFLTIGESALAFSDLFESTMLNGGQEVLNKLGDAFNSLVGLVGTIVEEIADALTGLYEHLDPKTNEFTQNMLAAWQTAFENISSLCDTLGETLSSVMDNGGQELLNSLGDLVMQISGTFGQLVGIVADSMSKFFEHMDPGKNSASKGAIDALTYTIDSIRDFIDVLGDSIQYFLDNGGQDFINNLGDIIALIADLGLTIAGDIISSITAFFDSWAGHIVIAACGESLEIVSTVLEALLELLEPFTPLLSGLLAGFAAFKVSLPIIGFITKLVAGFKTLAGAGGIIAVAKTALSGLWAVLAANPIAATVAAIVGIGVALVACYEKFEGFRAIVDTILGPLNKALEAIVDTVIKVFDDIVDIFRNIIDIIVGIFTGDGQKVGNAVRELCGNILSLFGDIVIGIADIGWNIITGLAEGIWNGIKAIPTLLAGIGEFIIDFFKGLFGIHSPSTVFAELGVNLIEGLVEGILDALKSVTEALGKISDAISDWFKGLLSEASEKWSSLCETTSEKWNNIKETVSEKCSDILNNTKEKWTDIKDKTIEIVSKLKDDTEEKYNNFKDKLTDTMDKLRQNSEDKWTKVKNKTSDLVSNLKSTVEDKYSTMKDALTNKLETLRQTSEDKWNNIKTKAGELVSNLKSDVENKYETLKNNLDSKMDTLKSNMQTKWDNIKSKTSEIVNNLKSTVEEKYNTLKSNLGTKLEEVKNEANTKWNNIKSTTITKVGEVVSEATSKFGEMKSTFRTKIDEVKSELGPKWEELKNDAKTRASGFANGVSEGLSGLKTKFTKPFEDAKKSIGDIITNIGRTLKNASWSLPKIKLPHIKISGWTDFLDGAVSIPKFSLEWYKRGGIIDGITPLGMTGNTIHMGGEAGKEMVVPLENTSFTSKIAQAMGQAVDNAMARNANNMYNSSYNVIDDRRDIVLQINDREFARASINSINKLQAESGKTLLNI